MLEKNLSNGIGLRYGSFVDSLGPTRTEGLMYLSASRSHLPSRWNSTFIFDIQILVTRRAMASYNSDAPVLDTYHAVVAAYSDFLTVAIHTILYERNIYPQNSFIKARKYNYPVRQSRHPKVCKWIMDAVSAVQAEMLKVGWATYRAFRRNFTASTFGCLLVAFCDPVAEIHPKMGSVESKAHNNLVKGFVRLRSKTRST